MISYIIPIAYDHAYAIDAIRSVYPIADEIVLGLDRDRLTWSQKPFEIDLDTFKAAVRQVDPRGIIRIVEDDFHSEDHPMKNDTRERNRLTEHCKEGNWLVQLDSDERALNPKDFKGFLSQLDPSVDASAEFITVFKVIDGKCLVTERPWERCPVATKARRAYKTCRTTGRNLVLSNLKIFHFSWGRTRAELEKKVSNWGRKQMASHRNCFRQQTARVTAQIQNQTL